MLDLLDEQIPEGMEGRSLLHDHPPRAIVAATFSAGPMRWMWRQGDVKVVIRTADQPALGDGARRSLEETDPLPEGVFYYDLRKDPIEMDPHALPTDILPSVARDFARSAGSMVPGLQVFSVGTTGGSKFDLEYPGERVIQQIWSVGPVSVSWNGPDLRVEDPNAGPFSLVAVGDGGEIETVIPGQTTSAWQYLSDGVEYAPTRLIPDETFHSPGSYLWWNPERDLVVGHHEETLQKLKALGYIK
jgi:hypothetical protein